MADDADKSSFAPIAMGCGLVFMLSVCFGPMALSFGMAMWWRTAASSYGGGPPMPMPPPTGGGTPGVGGPLMPAPLVPPPPMEGYFYLTVLEERNMSFALVGLSCVLEVRDTDDLDLPCQANVVCGGARVYGGAGQGYYPCASEPGSDGIRNGVDDAPTSADGDARLSITDDRVVVSDEGGTLGTFSVTLARPATGHGE